MRASRPKNASSSASAFNLGDVVEESDGDLMGDGVNIAARLEGIAEPGAICLSEDAYRQVKGRLDLAVTDLGPTDKNIAEPIHVYSLEVGKLAQARPASIAPAPEKFAPPRLSMVVLPFANLGGDPEQDYFVDGVTENLTTDLSRLRGSFVIGRHTAFAYRGKAIDLKQIGSELSVRYVLEGSVQRASDRMRVNVQLIDATTGAHLWAERFDKPLADLFEMQDQIVARLANVLTAQLVEAEARRAARSPNPDSMDLYFQGGAHLNRALTPDNVARAQSFFDRALSADPDNVDALAASGVADAMGGVSGFASDHQAAFAAAEAKLTKALSLAPDHARAHNYLGFLHMVTKRAALGIAECEHALELDRNLATAHGSIGLGKLYVGRAEETEGHSVEALRLSPRDTAAYLWMFQTGAAKLYLGVDDQAVGWLRQSVESNRNYPPIHFHLGSALAHLGRLDEARSALKAGLALHPKFTISFARVVVTAVCDHPIYLAGYERFLEGLRKAGLPEH
jgi:TolB-like protein/Flp pilus assembly protein TadD